MSSELDFRSIYEHCYKGSDFINIGEHFEEFKNVIKSSGYGDKTFEEEDKKFLASLVGDDVDEEKFDLLSEYCSIDKLTVPGELKRSNKANFEWFKDPEDPSIIDKVTLHTVANAKKRNKFKNYQIHSKYRSERPIYYAPEPSTSAPLLKPESDILVYVRVYVPFASRHKYSEGALGKLSVNFVIAIPGFFTLDKLRDVINCVSDLSVSTEMSNTPIRHSQVENAKDVYKSGFFFIENTFYNDFRDPNNHDNSQVIRDWLESRKFNPCSTAKMEETRIDSLVVRFGFPWVYQHQGDCEHLISFSDARFVNASDELNSTCYPRIVRIKPRPNRYCMTCGLYNVSWVTTSNNRLPHNPCMFCDSCFKSYNYIKGKKVGSFQAYPYPYDTNIFNTKTLKAMPKKRVDSKKKKS